MPLRLSAQGADKDEALAGLMDNSRVSPGLGSAVALGSGQRMGMWEGRAFEPLGVQPFRPGRPASSVGRRGLPLRKRFPDR